MKLDAYRQTELQLLRLRIHKLTHQAYPFGEFHDGRDEWNLETPVKNLVRDGP
jgi:hypothetical protein